MIEDSKLDLAGTGYCASFNFRRTARAVTRMYDRELQEFRIRSTQFTILVGIAKNQPVSIGAMAEVLLIDPTTLTRSLRLLQKEGLVMVSKRAARRQRFLALTPHGERVLAQSLPAWRKAHARFLAMVGPEYWIGLRHELERLAFAVTELEQPQRATLAQTAASC
jgi:DNA-binding MarR family transcriptional regulator